MKKLPPSLLIVVAIMIISVDQLSKYFMTNSNLIVFNQGASFGLVPSTLWPLIIVPVLGLLIYEVIKANNRYSQIGLVLIISAGFSNLLDRFILGAVRDFIHYKAINTVGNIADIIIGFGIGVLVLSQGIQKKVTKHDA